MKIKKKIKNIFNKIKIALKIGKHYECPICSYKGPFLNYAQFGKPRKNIKCPDCKSLERHRFIYLVMRKNNLLQEVEQKSILHFAPEKIFKDIFSRSPLYKSADISPGKADLVLDISKINLPNNSVDFILANHVLEHVPDDTNSLKEINRILTNHGFAIITIPIKKDLAQTIEDPGDTDPEYKLKHFGHKEHVRQYGNDFTQKLKKLNIVFEEYTPAEKDLEIYSLKKDDSVFILRKTKD